MKAMKSCAALLLVLLLAASLCACSALGGNSIDHSWRYTVDFEKAITAAGGMDELDTLGGDMGSILSGMVEGLTMDMILDLKSDQTFTFYTDEDSAKAAIEGMIDNLGKKLPEIMAPILGIDAEQVSAVLSAAGMSTDALLDSIRKEMDTEKILQDLNNNSLKGSYRYEDGKLYLTAQGQTEDPGAYLTVVLQGKELRITEIHGVSEFEKYESMLPMIFTR